MDGEGGGYMVHSQWQCNARTGYFDLREQSCMFGWGLEYTQWCQEKDEFAASGGLNERKELQQKRAKQSGEEAKQIRKSPRPSSPNDLAS